VVVAVKLVCQCVFDPHPTGNWMACLGQIIKHWAKIVVRLLFVNRHRCLTFGWGFCFVGNCTAKLELAATFAGSYRNFS